jgi:pectin methylesterase-like acyl-CoA thioesterase
MNTMRAAITSSVFLVALGGHLMAATVQVGTCRSGVVTFSTIQSAVNASTAGARVLVCPGTYPEQVVIKKSYLFTVSVHV